MSANSNLITVVFRNHVMPDEHATKAAGRPIFSEMEVCDIYFAANTKTKATFPAHDAEPNATREAAKDGGGVITYAMLYNEQYKAFKNGSAQPMSGTPLSEAPFLKEAKRRELKALNVHTVEALAALDGTPLKQLGMGGRELKNQAQAYLDAAAGTADVTALAAENEAQRQHINELQKQMAEMMALLKSQPAPVQPPPAQTGSVEADPVDLDAFDDDDLRAFIEQNGGSKPRSNASRESLLAAAKELAAG